MKKCFGFETKQHIRYLNIYLKRWWSSFFRAQTFRHQFIFF